MIILIGNFEDDRSLYARFMSTVSNFRELICCSTRQSYNCNLFQYHQILGNSLILIIIVTTSTRLNFIFVNFFLIIASSFRHFLNIKNILKSYFDPILFLKKESKNPFKIDKKCSVQLEFFSSLMFFEKCHVMPLSTWHCHRKRLT